MLDAVHHFPLKGKPVFCEPYGEGHINRTYQVITDQDEWYILQHINSRVFLDIGALMENIGAVTRHLAKKDSNPRHTLTIVPTLHGKDYYVDEAGQSFRMYIFVRDSLCLQQPEDPQDLYRSGLAFGRFQRQLADFPAAQLHHTIENFHNTPDRYRKFHEARRANPQNRLKDVQPEVDFALERENRAGRLQAMQQQGLLLTRVTHNDTKLNNVLLDAVTRDPLCVIDLDTVMPGLAAHDFGDTIRFGASTAAEDEKDLSLVTLSLEQYESYARGFLKECGASLNQDEIATLHEGAWAMTLECGVRFLTDYLMGDTYFRIHRPEHNLDRCRTQFKLVADMESKWQQMEEVIGKLS
ncbi:MAG: aminoglycoside phosphotransferase family protein [Clostridiales bacterium]|nr:aminoglycoside phosphotransferase family protein [Clostridiales bacterium]